MPFRLCDTPLFRGIPESEIEPLLRRLGAVRRQYQKGETILPEGAPAGGIGLVLSGLAVIQSVDIWGNGSILGSAGPGGVFADAYACLPGEPLAVTVQAARPAQVLLVPLGPVLSGAPGACPHQVTLLRNLLAVCAGKSLQLSRRMTHTAPRPSAGGCSPICPSARVAAAGRPFPSLRPPAAGGLPERGPQRPVRRAFQNAAGRADPLPEKPVHAAGPGGRVMQLPGAEMLFQTSDRSAGLHSFGCRSLSQKREPFPRRKFCAVGERLPFLDSAGGQPAQCATASRRNRAQPGTARS